MNQTNDISILENQLEGLRVRGVELRADETLFVKAQGIDETIQRNLKERTDLEEKLKKSKEALKLLQGTKKKAVDSVSKMICDKLNEFLPIGEAFFDALDGLSFGWMYDDTKQPYNSLSGGQKCIFDAALENTLGSNIIVLEAAEMDQSHLMSLLEETAGNEKQVFVNTWFKGFKAPKGFGVVEIR